VFALGKMDSPCKMEWPRLRCSYSGCQTFSSSTVFYLMINSDILQRAKRLRSAKSRVAAFPM